MHEIKNGQVVISFLGDLTCDRPMLRAAKQKDGRFDFDQSLAGLKPLLEDSDYVVGNLETVCAGEKLGYNPGAITYNTPDDFIPALKRSGVNILTTANNHCLDCGADGLIRTLKLLDENGIAHTGTYASPDEKERILYLQKNGITIAIVSFTAVMNRKPNGRAYTASEWNRVDNLKKLPQESGSIVKQIARRIIPVTFVKELKAKYDRLKGIPLVKVRVDNEKIEDCDLQNIEKAISLLHEAGTKADIVIACIHSGGQFNIEPGQYTKALFEKLTDHADIIIGHHPHVIQKMERKKGRVQVYSLGSVNMSPSGDYVDHDCASEYSMMLKFFIQNTEEGIRFETEPVLLCASEDSNHYVYVRQANHNEETNGIMSRFVGSEM